MQSTKRLVLLVDDDKSIRLLFSAALTQAGYEVMTAQNGREAVEILQHTLPAVIVLDLVMPEREGLETLREILRGHPALPVIAVSGAAAAPRYLNVANLLGARRTLQKPIQPSELVREVNAAIGDL